MKIWHSSSPSPECTGATKRRAARLETLGILHHDHLPLPYSGAAPFRIMRTGVRLVRRARASMSGGSAPSSENRINS